MPSYAQQQQNLYGNSNGELQLQDASSNLQLARAPNQITTP
ncbi:hypothetical protein LA76x_4187 [Lysobacter antibioticus]|uniref:Uncharacterized protein n=1 Tax=Lysobacter antibioticus TaxID=84531 RepID=A0A0S2FFK0_LYSAN|nr:hypothetical protein LA76x_4187 [Lysobacter antibioticus]